MIRFLVMRKKDWIWVLALPAYLIFGTLRHEAAHAVSAMLEGAQITQFVILPGWYNQQIIFGYVRYLGSVSWLTTAAPYLLDLLTFSLVYPVCMRVVFKQRWVWLNLVILGLISPAVNSLYQYLKPAWGMNGDAAELFSLLPDSGVHAYFILTLIGYTLGLWAIFSHSRQVQMDGQN
jgi:hypothetical protein